MSSSLALKDIELVRNIDAASINGVGIHSGNLFQVRLHPLPELATNNPIEFFSRLGTIEYSSPALWTRLSGTTRSTALVLRGPTRRKLELRTVEHFMAAALMSGLRARVEVLALSAETGDILEMPVLDGAAAEWMAWMQNQKAFLSPSERREAWHVVRAFEVKDGGRRVRIAPLNRAGAFAEYHCTVDFAPRWRQEAFFEINWREAHLGAAAFSRNIAPARTFAFAHELKALEARGLGRGGSLKNAILLDGDRVINDGGFRIPNELAAHKLLDAVGDFALLGAPLIARVECVQAGHSMHVRAIEEAVRTGAIEKRIF